jgi:hypothetical protein
MRRAVVPAVVVLLVGLVGAGLAVASSRTGIVHETDLRFAVGFGDDATGDVGPVGDSAGDTFFGQARLSDFDLTKQLGGYNSACVLENLTPRWNHCTATVLLPGGTVELSSRFVWTDARPGFRLAVVGGTGVYGNVVGQATYTFGCDACPQGTEDVDTLTLKLMPSFAQP